MIVRNTTTKAERQKGSLRNPFVFLSAFVTSWFPVFNKNYFVLLCAFVTSWFPVLNKRSFVCLCGSPHFPKPVLEDNLLYSNWRANRKK